MGVSKHYAAWSQALRTALAISFTQAALQRAADHLVRQMLEVSRLVYERPTVDSDGDTVVYYGDEPCNCAMCRPVGGRPYYDC